MIRRFKAALILFFLFSVFTARADEMVTPERIISGEEIALHDGRVLRLAGIKSASPEAKAFLESIVSHHTLILQDGEVDRYGRIAATASIQGQVQSLEESLLSNGLAFVYPASGGANLDQWCTVERTARLSKIGLWASHTDTDAADAKGLNGKYGFITGTIVKSERINNKVYLNFGLDWHTAFSVTIAAHDLRTFKKQGIDPLSLQGKKCRVRGWLTQNPGPGITVTDPHQIEIE